MNIESDTGVDGGTITTTTTSIPIHSCKTTTTTTTTTTNVDVGYRGIDRFVAVTPATTGTVSNNTESSNNNNNNNNKVFLQRMYVHPFCHLFPKLRVTPVRYQTRIPIPRQLHQQLSATTTTNSSEMTSNYNYTIDYSGSSDERMEEWKSMWLEWKSIWEQMHDFMSHNTILQEMKRDKLVQWRIVVVFILGLYVPELFLGDDKQVSMYVSGFWNVLLILCMIAFTIHTYVYYGEPNHRIMNTIIRIPSTYSHVLQCLLSLIVALWIVINLVMVHEENYLAWYDIFTLVMWCVVLFLLLYMTCRYMIKPLLMSCRNRCAANWDQRDYALRAVHCELQRINNDLIHFTLVPKMVGTFRPLVDVYKKAKGSSNNNNCSTDGLLSQPLPSSSLSSSSLSVLLGGGGGGGGGTKRRGLGVV